MSNDRAPQHESTATPPTLQIESLHKAFGDLKVLRGIDLEINKGEVVCIIGPSGGGKTTLLRCINLLEVPDRGVVRLEGRPIGFRETSDGRLHKAPQREIDRTRAQIGMVFQHFNLWPHKTALENVTEGPIVVRKTDPKVAIRKGEELLARVGMAANRNDYPATLSGGQKQRVAIARALAMEPKVMLFDEVTSALDPELVQEVLDVMEQVASEGMTMVVVTHEMGFACSAADRIVFVADGVVVEQGSPEWISSSCTDERTRKFLAAVV